MTRNSLLVGSAAVFLFADWAPDTVLRYGLGTVIGSAGVLLGSLYLTMVDKLVGLAGFLAIAGLYLEHRRRILGRIRTNVYASKTGSLGTLAALNAGSPPTQPGETHPAHETPSYEESSFAPEDEKGDAAEPGSAGSLDEKQPLDTVGQNTKTVSEFFQEKGLARI